MPKRIPLSKGQYALVDDEDVERVSGWWWTLLKGGYVIRHKGDDGVTIYMHKVIMPAPDGLEVDHINGDLWDNRKCNLRICTHRENTCNRHKKDGYTSQYRGVSWSNQAGKWNASIKRTRIGYFDSEVEAAKAWDAEASARWGEFAFLNLAPQDHVNIEDFEIAPRALKYGNRTWTSQYRGVNYDKAR